MKRKPIFQAVIALDPFVVKQFKSFDTACNVDCLYIIKKEFVRTHITLSGGEYDIFNYSFLNKYQLSTPVVINKWCIEDIYPGHYGRSVRYEGHVKITNYSVWNVYSISDPFGELRDKSFATPKEAIENLILFSKHSSWPEFESKK
jgi:hypothetical protein